jgi:hypothetical protein
MTSQSAATIAFEGTIPSAVRDTLTGQLSIAADAAKADCILFDGAGGPTPERMRQILDAGKTLIQLNPTADQLRQIGKIGGIAITAPMPAVALSRSPKGHYCLTAFPESEAASPNETPGQPVSAPRKKLPESPIQVRLAELLRTRNMMAAIDVAPTPLAPPGGAYFGMTSIQCAASPQIGPVPSDCNENAGASQQVSLQSVITFYVYWANGASPSNYLIIAKQAVANSIGSPLNNDALSKGFMMYGTWASTGMTQPTSCQLTLTQTSPNPGDVAASVSQLMDLIVYVKGGPSQSQLFTAAEQTPLSLPDWSLKNRAMPANGSSEWFFGETTPWNTIETPQFPPPDWHDVFFNDGICLPFDSISTGVLQPTTYSAWTIANPAWTTTPASNAPQPCAVAGGTYIEQDCVLVWAWGGSNSGYPGYMREMPSNSIPFTLQLDTIAVKTPASP